MGGVWHFSVGPGGPGGKIKRIFPTAERESLSFAAFEKLRKKETASSGNNNQ